MAANPPLLELMLGRPAVADGGANPARQLRLPLVPGRAPLPRGAGGSRLTFRLWTDDGDNPMGKSTKGLPAAAGRDDVG